MSYRVVILDGPTGPGNVEEQELASIGARVVRARTGGIDELRSLVADADAILCDATPITAPLLDQAPKVQVISEYGIGYDNVDVAAASQRGIWVANVPGFCVEEVADHALALILAAGRRLFPLDRSVHAGHWDPVGVAAGVDRLSNQTLGLIGFGQIGRRVARRAAGFGFRILAYSPHTTPEVARQYGAERAERDEVLAASDFISLHVPGGPATRHLIDARALALCKSTAWLINTARGSVVDEPALLDALHANRLAGAALDVRQAEPAPPGDALRDLPNVILTPHAAFYSAQSLLELRQRAARNVVAVLAGGQPVDPVNPDVEPRSSRQAKGNEQMWV
jgi:D-3-phosphoglycerate dehydrogenase